MTHGDPSILEEALNTSLERGREYGPPDANFAATRRLWNAYIANKLHEMEPHDGFDDILDDEDYPLLMLLAKVARLQTGDPDRDTLTDTAGYARAAAEVLGFERLDYENGLRVGPNGVRVGRDDGVVVASTETVDPEAGDITLAGHGEGLPEALRSLADSLEEYS